MVKTLCKFVTVLAVVLLSPGCALLTGAISRAVSPPGSPVVVPAFTLQATEWRPGHLIAGVGRAEITPPPGFPTGGDGPAGNLARGYWTQLYTRAFFFADAQGKTTVLVSVDAFAIPGGLSAMVAHDVGTKWNALGIIVRPDAILIAATHTHQGPGNYLTAGSHNQFGSKFSGFSRPLFDFLVAQITLAIDRAISDALAHDAEALIYVRETRAEHLQLNRSPSTFLLNPTSQMLMDSFHHRVPLCESMLHHGEAARSGWELPGCPRIRAADPRLTTIELRRGTARIGVIISFAMHPTVLDPAAPVNSGDFAGIAALELEREWSGRSAPVVVGFFNGAEGDIVARRDKRDVNEVINVARMFGRYVKAAVETPASPMNSPAIVARRIFIGPSASCEDPGAPHLKLADAPVPGTAALGGGEDDRTPLFALGWRDGVRYLARNGQGPKLPALDSELLPAVRATAILGPPRVWPQELPLQFIRIGPLAFAAFPAELSTATGALVRARLSPFVSPLAVIGLANEYTQYVASPDEYGAQDYMAASTLWGPYEAEVFACRMQQLATGEYQEQMSAERKSYSPGTPPEENNPPLSFGPLAVGEERAAPEEELERILVSASGAPARNLHFVEWQETVTDSNEEFAAAGRRVVRIQIQQDGAWVTRQLASASGPDDDSGVGFVSLLRFSPSKQGIDSMTRHWRAFWITPLIEGVAPAAQYRFEVESRDQQGSVIFCRTEAFLITEKEGRPPAHACRKAVAPSV